MINVEPPYMITAVPSLDYMKELVELFERTDQHRQIMHIPVLTYGTGTWSKQYILIHEYMSENVTARIPSMPHFTCCEYNIEFMKDIIEEAYREFPKLKDADPYEYPDSTYNSWVSALTWAALKQIHNSLPDILDEIKFEFSKEFVNTCVYDQSGKKIVKKR
ncbi:MAG TPA: hypothetical protein PLA71_06660 [Saccharofermentans sp.]|nr:hypothetical protein [Saccharofermentans sp.]